MACKGADESKVDKLSMMAIQGATGTSNICSQAKQVQSNALATENKKIKDCKKMIKAYSPCAMTLSGPLEQARKRLKTLQESAKTYSDLGKEIDDCIARTSSQQSGDSNKQSASNSENNKSEGDAYKGNTSADEHLNNMNKSPGDKLSSSSDPYDGQASADKHLNNMNGSEVDSGEIREIPTMDSSEYAKQSEFLNSAEGQERYSAYEQAINAAEESAYAGSGGEPYRGFQSGGPVGEGPLSPSESFVGDSGTGGGNFGEGGDSLASNNNGGGGDFQAADTSGGFSNPGNNNTFGQNVPSLSNTDSFDSARTQLNDLGFNNNGFSNDNLVGQGQNVAALDPAYRQGHSLLPKSSDESDTTPEKNAIAQVDGKKDPAAGGNAQGVKGAFFKDPYANQHEFEGECTEEEIKQKVKGCEDEDTVASNKKPQSLLGSLTGKALSMLGLGNSDEEECDEDEEDCEYEYVDEDNSPQYAAHTNSNSGYNKAAYFAPKKDEEEDEYEDEYVQKSKSVFNIDEKSLRDSGLDGHTIAKAEEIGLENPELVKAMALTDKMARSETKIEIPTRKNQAVLAYDIDRLRGYNDNGYGNNRRLPTSANAAVGKVPVDKNLVPDLVDQPNHYGLN